ncbi:MAG: PAS domain S-box protein, partial [Chitinophagia bacterium]|nr:PAS domain S-box protein [Chitinophagia bacterium]
MNIDALNLLILKDGHENIDFIYDAFEDEGIALTYSAVHTLGEMEMLVPVARYDGIVVFCPGQQYKAQDVLDFVSDNCPHLPLLLLLVDDAPAGIRKLLKKGVADYVLYSDRARLPHAVTAAIERYTLRTEQESFFNELTARKSLMKDAERLAHFGSWREDVENNRLYWSDEKFRILGLAPGSVKPSWEHFYACVHPEDVEFVKTTMEDTLLNRNRQKFTFRILGGNGQVKYIHSELFVTRDSNLKLAQLNGFIRDISEHTEAEIRLVESEEKYRNLFENNPSALFVINSDTNEFIDVNKTAVLQYGYSREEFLKMTTYELIPEPERAAAIRDKVCFPIHPNEHGVWENLDKYGRTIQVEITISELIFEGNNSKLILANDVTDKLL